jgi:alginate O-acetyltransferase complex protein AlgJ
VRVLDLVPDFLVDKSEAQLYCRQDTHWSGAACERVAQLLAHEIRDRPWYPEIPKHEFAHETKFVEITGDLRGELNNSASPKESLPLRFVGTRNGGALDSVPPDADSPVILMGDSHNLVFHVGGDLHAVGAGLPDQLALELGFAVDVVAVRGSGATPARINLMRRARSPGYLAGKKLVIWCFAAREFTESPGWMQVPIVR